MPPKRRQYDSSITRVGPVFDALVHQPNWIRRLLELPRHGHPQHPPETPADLRPVHDGLFWNGELGGGREYALGAPVALLSWLIRNVSVSQEPEDGDPTNALRSKLGRRDPDTVRDALRALRSDGGKLRAWHLFEGPSCPDAFIITGDALIVVEGKRTEPTTTTSTKWMPGRHQMLRHLDGAWEIRGGRKVIGMLIVEGNREGDVPARWMSAAREVVGQAAIQASFPHRSADEAEAIARCFRGVATWQAICDHFGLDRNVVLHDTV